MKGFECERGRGALVAVVGEHLWRLSWWWWRVWWWWCQLWWCQLWWWQQWWWQLWWRRWWWWLCSWGGGGRGRRTLVTSGLILQLLYYAYAPWQRFSLFKRCFRSCSLVYICWGESFELAPISSLQACLIEVNFISCFHKLPGLFWLLFLDRLSTESFLESWAFLWQGNIS